MSTASKRQWRLKNPERSRAAERKRAKARRLGTWALVLGEASRPCASSDSYWRYEHSMKRWEQRLWYPTLGAGAHRLTKSERRALIKRVFAAKLTELEQRFAVDDQFLASLGVDLGIDRTRAA